MINKYKKDLDLLLELNPENKTIEGITKILTSLIPEATYKKEHHRKYRIYCDKKYLSMFSSCILYDDIKIVRYSDDNFITIKSKIPNYDSSFSKLWGLYMYDNTILKASNVLNVIYKEDKDEEKADIFKDYIMPKWNDDE